MNLIMLTEDKDLEMKNDYEELKKTLDNLCRLFNVFMYGLKIFVIDFTTNIGKTSWYNNVTAGKRKF